MEVATPSHKILTSSRYHVVHGENFALFYGSSFFSFFEIIKNFTVPAASVRARAVFSGPIPPELTADTLMTYMV